MEFSSLLRKDFILLDLDYDDRFDALRHMARFLHERGYVRDTFEEAIIRREEAHPSGLPMEGQKIAIPHTGAEHVNSSVILFARLKQPVVFHCMGDPGDTMELRLISMFALKEAKKIGDLLEALIRVYQNNEALEQIINAETVDEVYEILRENMVTETA
jgi:PTS system galactitol-specific IIA component